MKSTVAAVALLLAAPAEAADKLRELCPDRPGIGTPACIVDAGHVLVETGLVDWTLDRQPDTRTDTILFGDTLVRIGLGETAEAQVEWTPAGHVRDRDRLSGAISRSTRVGDVTLAVRQNLINPDGSEASVSIQPFVTLPVGRRPVGAGDWGTGLIVPASYELTKSIKLDLSPRVYAAVDEDGNGRHLAYGSVAGVDVDLTDKFTATLELEAMRDRDPTGHETDVLGGVSAGFQPNDDLQIDAGANAGLNHAAPDVELHFGVSRRF